MSTRVIVPDFNFSAHYYADILRNLRTFNRQNAPEITAEVAEEVFIQLERAFALVGHLNNCLLDLAANETMLPTAKLLDCVQNILKLIGYQLADYSPATVELLLELTQVPSTSVLVVPANSGFATERAETAPAIPFEVLTDKYVGPATALDAVFTSYLKRSGSDGVTVYGDPTTIISASLAIANEDLGGTLILGNSIYGNGGEYLAASIITPGSPCQVRLARFGGGQDPLFIAENSLSWKLLGFGVNGAADVASAGSPYLSTWAECVPGNCLYFGSAHVMWNAMALTFETPAMGIQGVWEYFDPNLSDVAPAAVTNLGTSLKFNATSLLGTGNRNGSLIRVTHLPTGVVEYIPSVYTDGVNYVTTTAFLGQSGTPSLDPNDYSIGSDWTEVPDVSDGTLGLGISGSVSFSIPQTSDRRWCKTVLNGVDAYYLRFRIISVGLTPTAPVIDAVDIGVGTQWVLATAIQGESVLNETLVSSSNQAGQEFELNNYPALRDSVEVYVTEGGSEVTWTNVTLLNRTLIQSGPLDRHYQVRRDAEGILTIKFGDGTYGKIPPLGADNIRFTYRVNAVEDGNVGAGMVVVNSGGAALVKSVTNPRPAAGWQEAEGVSETSLARVKEAGPASLRALERAVTGPDHEYLATNWRNSAGNRPVVRAKAIEEGFGPKTIKLVVVGTNGVGITAEDKAALELYFNGDETNNIPGYGGSNRRVVVVNFTPRLLALVVVIEANSALSWAAVATRLATLLSPTAADPNGSGFLWAFGGRVPLSRVESEVFGLSPGNVFDVDVTIPAVDPELMETELPMLDTAHLTITIAAPRR